MPNPYTPGVYWDFSLFFESDRGDGWSESYRFLQADVADYDAVADAIVGDRLPCLVEAHHLVYVRLSDPAKSRDVYPLAVLTTLPKPGEYVVDTEILPADQGIKVKVFCELGTYMIRCLHGVAADGMLTDESWTPGGAVLTPAATFYATLITKKWMVTNPFATPHLPAFTNRYCQLAALGKAMNHKIGRPFGLRPGRSSP
jgi:hypothetical protein